LEANSALDGCRRAAAKLNLAFALVGAVALALDQATKFAAFALLHRGARAVIPGFLNLSLSKNPGAAFGILRGQNLLLIGISLAAMAFILYMQLRGLRKTVLSSVALGLMLGGALGNLVDRLYLGVVRDFIDAHLGARHWPTFNVADMVLCVGAGLLILVMGREKPKDNESNAAVTNPDS